jgi:Secretion system C-terminal sorting domain
MKKSLLLFSFLIVSFSLLAQKDSVRAISTRPNKTYVKEVSVPNINIYPVPVREDAFSIKTDRDMTLVKVTNMIGQEIYRSQYKSPLSFTKVQLQNPTRGIYLVTISFIDGTRIVKKILVEDPE